MSQLRTWSGVLAPIGAEGGEVNIIDLAVHLGRTVRFGGYGSPEWTVLHHSTLVALIAMRLEHPPEVVQAALLHDFHEAYTGDIPSPIKAMFNDAYSKDPDKTTLTKTVEDQFDKRIFGHLNTKAADAKTRKVVKQCDRIALVIEGLLFGPTDCDLLEIIDDEAERAELTALCERVVPGFNKMVRRKYRGH